MQGEAVVGHSDALCIAPGLVAVLNGPSVQAQQRRYPRVAHSTEPPVVELQTRFQHPALVRYRNHSSLLGETEARPASEAHADRLLSERRTVGALAEGHRSTHEIGNVLQQRNVERAQGEKAGEEEPVQSSGCYHGKMGDRIRRQAGRQIDRKNRKISREACPVLSCPLLSSTLLSSTLLYSALLSSQSLVSPRIPLLSPACTFLTFAPHPPSASESRPGRPAGPRRLSD
eukprot:759283-Hanusia_phi.AAC.3